jgi:hypothetical protein
VGYKDLFYLNHTLRFGTATLAMKLQMEDSIINKLLKTQYTYVGKVNFPGVTPYHLLNALIKELASLYPNAKASSFTLKSFC